MDAVFLPNPPDRSYQIEVCNHRYGKTMTYTDATDTLSASTSYNPYTAMLRERGIKGSVFVSYGEFSDEDFDKFVDDEKDGVIFMELYDDAPSLISKIDATPAQQISEQEFLWAYENEMLPTFLAAVGRKPIALSYRKGVNNFKDYVLPSFLAARWSPPLSNFSTWSFPTDYGNGCGNPSNVLYPNLTGTSAYNNRYNTMRWYDEARAEDNDFSGVLTILGNKVDETMLNGGWFVNFTHWHNYWSDGNEEWAEEYLDLLAAKNANHEIYFSGYGEAVAYLVYRQLITKSVMYSPKGRESNTLIIFLKAVNTLNVNTDLLQVPITIKFSTVGTPLEGQQITSSCNLVSLGNGEYLVEIPYNSNGYPCAVINKKI